MLGVGLGKRVAIIFEEELGGPGFNVYMEGNNIEADQMTNEEQLKKLSPADFWALRAFQVVTGLLLQSGAVSSMKKKGDS
jgi:hypothetical protein